MRYSYLSIKKHVTAIMRMGWIVQPLKQRWKKFRLRFVKKTDQRKLNRYRCKIDAALISGRLARVEGRIKDMSIGGCLFRPGSFYLVDRAGEEVTIELGEATLVGKVVRTLPIGYAVQFEDLLDDDVLDEALKLSAVEAELFNKSQEDETKETEEKAKDKLESAKEAA